MEIFAAEPDGRQRDMRKLMGRRNYMAIVAYDPDVVTCAYGQKNVHGTGTGRLSLAVDIMVQTDAVGMGAAGVSKYGPVVVPSLDFGR